MELPLTEQINSSTIALDTLGTSDLLHRINDEDRRAAWAVEREIDSLASAVDAIAQRVRSGGTLHYFGAGTSGRLGVLDATEIVPTFSASGLVCAHLAGGTAAMTAAIEGAEDDEDAGYREARECGIAAGDAVLGISASGTTPYVRGALRAARQHGALTMCLINDPAAPLVEEADLTVVLRTGPEVIAGSTRMKAASAQKMALTMLSTALMVKLGKVHGNLMIDMRPASAKLRARARRMVESLGGATASEAARALETAGYDVKTAIVMLRLGCSENEARRKLELAGGRLATLMSGPDPASPQAHPRSQRPCRDSDC